MIVHYVVIETARPSGSFGGHCEEAWYTVDGDVVTLCTREGVPHLDGHQRKITAKVGERETAKQVAGRLLRANLATLGRKSSGFDRELVYPRQGLA